MSTILGPDFFPVRGRKHSRRRVGSLKVETEELATTYLTSRAFSEERSLRSVEEINTERDRTAHSNDILSIL